MTDTAHSATLRKAEVTEAFSACPGAPNPICSSAVSIARRPVYSAALTSSFVTLTAPAWANVNYYCTRFGLNNAGTRGLRGRALLLRRGRPVPRTVTVFVGSTTNGAHTVAGVRGWVTVTGVW